MTRVKVRATSAAHSARPCSASTRQTYVDASAAAAAAAAGASVEVRLHDTTGCQTG